MVAVQERPLTEERMMLKNSDPSFFLTLKNGGIGGGGGGWGVGVTDEISWIGEKLAVHMRM